MFCCGTDKEAMLNGQSRSDERSWLPSSLTQAMKNTFQEKVTRWDVCFIAPELMLTDEEKLDASGTAAARQEQLDQLKLRRNETLKMIEQSGLVISCFFDKIEETAVNEDPSFLDKVKACLPGGKTHVPGSTVTYWLISAPEAKLREAAAAIGLEKQLKNESTTEAYSKDEVFAEYTIQTHDDFRADKDGSFFTTLERLQCIFHLIESPVYESPGCAAIDLDKDVKDGVWTSYFCLAEKDRRDSLTAKWVSVWTPWRSPPVQEIRDYLGEKVALYFAWLHMYTTWLFTLGLCSLVPYIYSHTWNDSPTDTPYDNWAMPIYGLLSMIWAQLFLEAWKREQSMWSYVWNTEDFEEEEALRPEFRHISLQYKKEWDLRNGYQKEEDLSWYQRNYDRKKGDTKKGRWTSVGFVSVPEEEHLNVQEVEWFSPRVRIWRLFLTASTTIILVAIIFSVTIILQAMKTYIAYRGGPLYGDFSQYIAALLQSAFIFIMTYIWSKIGPIMNNWEMHRTDTEWEDALMFKTFGFQFINSYGPAFYIAFVQSAHWTIPFLSLGTDDEGNDIPLRDHCLEDKCYKAIYLQMLIIILTKQVLRNFLAIVPPIINYAVSFCFPTKGDAMPGSDMHEFQIEVMRQSTLIRFPGTHVEYIEMAIQFGYVAIFAVAFPIGTIVCWLNNLVEKRADAFKINNLMQRPRYMGAQDIGSMQTILEAVAVISVFTNCGILYLSSEAYYSYFPVSWGERPNFKVFVFTIVVEHLVLLMKQVVAQLIPDTPSWVEMARARGVMRKEARTMNRLTDTQIKYKQHYDESKGAQWEYKGNYELS